MQIPFVDLNRAHLEIQYDLLAASERVIKSNYFIMGSEVSRFESNFAKFNGVKHAVSVGNGLDALIISLKALKVGKEDEVIIPSNTFIATALAVSAVGAKVVLAEPEMETYNISAKTIEPHINSKTKCIIPVHLYGQSCEMAGIVDLAKSKGIFIVEDNAQAQGASYRGKLTGSWGDINATSFYPGKNLGALGDGGAITTNSDELAHKAALYRNYGSVKRYHHDVLGTNSRLDEIQAAFLDVKLKSLNAWNENRAQIAAKYNSLLGGLDFLKTPVTAPGCTHTFHLYVIRTNKRDELRDYLKDKGIDTLIHYPIPIHRQIAYRQQFGDLCLPATEAMANEILSLPMYPGLGDAEIEYIANSVRQFFGGQ